MIIVLIQACLTPALRDYRVDVRAGSYERKRRSVRYAAGPA